MENDGSWGVKFLTSDLGWQLPWPHSGPPAEEVWKRKSKQGCMCTGLSLIGQDCPVCVLGVVGLPPEARQERVKERLAALVFPKQRKLPCIAGSRVA